MGFKIEVTLLINRILASEKPKVEVFTEQSRCVYEQADKLNCYRGIGWDPSP